MRFAIPFFVFLALCFGSAQAEARSCSIFAVIKSFDAEASTIEIEKTKGKTTKFFPKPEGTPRDATKIPRSCRGKDSKETEFVVKGSGGRLSITQVRTNFEGNMLNDVEDDSWLPSKLAQLIADKTTVVIVIRRGIGKDAPLGITTLYLPITEEELAQIKRLEAQGDDT